MGMLNRTVISQRADAETNPFHMWGTSKKAKHRMCSCLGPEGRTPTRQFILLVEDPYARADRVQIVESIRYNHPEILVVHVEGIHALSSSRRPSYAEDAAAVKAQYEVDFKNLFFRQETTVIPRNRERSTADGLAIVASGITLAERYATEAWRSRKAENRLARALHAVDALESARAVHEKFELGTAAVVPAFVTLAPKLWDAVADRYRALAEAAAPPRDPTDDDVEALASLVI
jgi:hypothetical protein